ncbi:hypothetical protein IQ268_09010 [Oculatella sp. LEGE 06141]|uniref:hypothetical protein n=1 Tax=Oculatella sp. LEGE 06141 TaxID=1828648 RepID=UPI00188112CE|nr:hypothetical protein [Oculatella sp. LEGE 06141]MBE9178698.1 hypothetical protein [Oculatella sp. LEGE 06141]
MLTNEDFSKLERSRFSRFADDILQVGKVGLYRDADNQIQIHCFDLEQVNELMVRLEHIRRMAFLVLGGDRLLICFAKAVHWQGSTLEGGLESESSFDEDELESPAMATATIDQTVDQVIDQEVDKAVNEAIDQALSQRMKDGSLEQRVRERVGARITTFINTQPQVQNGATTAVAEPPVSEPESDTEASKPKARKSSKMKLPKNFEFQVINRYRICLERLIPEKDRSEYLDEIAAQSDQAQAWLTKVAQAIALKYKKEEAKVYNGLLTEAQKMHKSLQPA